jgi:hypothetical protein
MLRISGGFVSKLLKSSKFIIGRCCVARALHDTVGHSMSSAKLLCQPDYSPIAGPAGDEVATKQRPMKWG